jgi:hypothetical protein
VWGPSFGAATCALCFTPEQRPSCRLLLHDPAAAAPLRLVLAALSLHDAPLAPPPFVRGPQGRLAPAKQPGDATTARARGPVGVCVVYWAGSCIGRNLPT